MTCEAVTDFLFSVDLEDIAAITSQGREHDDRVPALVERYLAFLAEFGARGTFFVVGNVARRWPDLVARIVRGGHEIGCHSDQHIPLDQLDPERFRRDTEANLNALRAAGASDIYGYRAPICSLTRRTEWAYDVLASLDFRYSSSVLPARNPMYGWAEFGGPQKRGSILEMPISIPAGPWLRVPFGGIYFRLLPEAYLRMALRRYVADGKPVLGYFHPYDIDPDERRHAYPGFERLPFLNFLMYSGRASLLAKLRRILKGGFRIVPYGQYLRENGLIAAT